MSTSYFKLLCSLIRLLPHREKHLSNRRRELFSLVRHSPKPLLLLALGALLAAGGCSTKNHNSDGTPKATNYPADGYLGITSVNPNDPLNPTHHHYRDDMRLMRQVIAQIPGIQGSAINFNGPNAHVNLELAKGMSEAEAGRIRDQAYQALSQNMPRYMIKVSTSRH